MNDKLLYREIAGAKQLCSEFCFNISPPPTVDIKAGFITCDRTGKVTVAVGYVWDGASGPTIDTDDSVCASLGHDALYELMRLGLLDAKVYKAAADWWFYERLIRDGMSQFRAYAWHNAVRIFGGAGVTPALQSPIKRAPVPFPAVPRETFEPIPGYRIYR